MEKRTQLVIDFWRALLSVVKYQQEHGLPCSYNTIFQQVCRVSDGIMHRVPDLRGVDVDDDFVCAWLAIEMLPQEKRLKLMTRMESEENLHQATLPGEEWRVIPKFPDYLVSNFGRIWSLKQRNGLMTPQRLNKGTRSKTKNPDKQRLYVTVNDYEAGNLKRKFLVHRLVAEAFIPNPDNLPQVDHIDENPQNNRADNLRWVTQEENLQYYANNHYAND